jgi:hypothetical protein
MGLYAPATLEVIHDAWYFDIGDPVTEAVDPGLPSFAARLNRSASSWCCRAAGRVSPTG